MLAKQNQLLLTMRMALFPKRIVARRLKGRRTGVPSFF
jgi:hypothetical protein